MTDLTPADRCALEIGRLFMRAHAAEQQAATLAAEIRNADQARVDAARRATDTEAPE